MSAQLQQLLIQVRRRYATLSEAYSLTVQLGDALDRGDRTSFGLLLAMRQEAILQLQSSEQVIKSLVSELPDEMEKKWRALVDGAAPESDEEQMITLQLSQNRELIDRLLSLNQRIEQGLQTRG